MIVNLNQSVMRQLNLTILFLLFFVLVSCSDKEEDVKPIVDVKSGAKSIVSFILTPLGVEGEIDETNHSISLVVPSGTDITSLTPTIEVSNKAVVSPASGVTQDFSGAVMYKVTAEDGSFEEYEVQVSIEGPSIILKPHVGSAEVARGSVLFIYGEDFGADASDAKIILESTSSDMVLELSALSGFFNDQMIAALIPEDAPLEDYKVKVVVNNQSVYMEEEFTIILPSPHIQEVSPLSIVPGETITISGKYFAESGNKVIISQGSSKKILAILNESSTSIEVRIPSSQDPGEYSIMVESNGKESHFNSKLTVNKSPTAPEITNIEKSSYNRGETIVITGKNLKKSGALTYIYFMTWPSGVSLMRNCSVNDEGTQATFEIPADFTTGTYVIYLSVDFEDTDEYKEIIQIK